VGCASLHVASTGLRVPRGLEGQGLQERSFLGPHPTPLFFFQFGLPSWDVGSSFGGLMSRFLVESEGGESSLGTQLGGIFRGFPTGDTAKKFTHPESRTPEPVWSQLLFACKVASVGRTEWERILMACAL
jgi:hypothetical protein